MKTPEELKAQKAKQMREYRQKLREANPEAFLEKQRIQKQKLRAKAKEKIFEVPYVEPKKSVKIKVIKKPPPLPSKLPDDLEDETPPPLPKTAPPSLTYKTKNIIKEIEKEIDDFKVDRPVYEVKKFVVEKAKRTKIEQVGNEVLADLIKRMDKTNLLKMAGPKVNEASLQKYANNIKRLYQNISNEPFDGDISFLHGVDVVRDYIEKTYTKSATRTDYFKSIVAILKRLHDYEDLAKEYGALMMKYKTENNEERGENILSDREQKNYVEWVDILKMPTDRLDDEDNLLYTLYTALPPRRLEYKYLKLVKGKTQAYIDKLSKEYNYLVVDAKNKAQKLIFHKYKTAKRYRTFIIDLTKPDQLPYLKFSLVRDAVKQFCDATKINNAELVFPDLFGKIYIDFTRRVNECFRSFRPKNISANILRHAFMSWAYQKPDISVNTIKMLAQYLGNSILEGLSYRKFKDAKQREKFEKELTEGE